MITIQPIDNDYRKGFTVKGHADYAPRGSDIVCASVSTIVRIAYNTLSRTNVLTINFNSGDAYIQIHEPSDASDLIIQGILETFEELMYIYPENVHLEEDTYYVTH
jgi:uncharacterized protein YsxB (DUF464 family)